MARSSNRNEKPRRPRPERERRGGKPKVCIFCVEKSPWVDYKDVSVLRRFVSDRGKIRARRVSGCCSQHQREVAVAVKTARELALLPYTQRTLSERGGGGGGGGRGGRGRDGDEDRGDRRGPRRDAPLDPVDAELAADQTSFGPDEDADGAEPSIGDSAGAPGIDDADDDSGEEVADDTGDDTGDEV